MELRKHLHDILTLVALAALTCYFVIPVLS